jgi:hypothetical protein
MIVTSNQALLLWTTSWTTGYSSLVAYEKKIYDLSFLSFIVFIMSLLYWSKPRRNIIRTIDISTSTIALLYHVYRSRYIQTKNRYALFAFGSLLFYPLGWYYHYKKRYWISMYCHALLHLSGNLSNLYLYELIYKTTQS